MPDTTTRSNLYRRSLRRLLGSSFLFLASLMLVASMGLAQNGEDRDCPDFNGDQQAAQDYFESRGPGDPDRLDADDDGIACEDPEDDGDNDSSQESVFEPNNGEDSVSGAQYEDDDQQRAVQTPATGGPDLLLLSASLLFIMGTLQLGLSYRRR